MAHPQNSPRGYFSKSGMNLGGADFLSNVTTGTIKSRVKWTPAASATTASITSHKLYVIGDETGTTAFGMGDPAVATTGLMACFGRTVLASGSMTDTAADFRIINRLVDSGGTHNMQGLYVKVKNYSSGTITGALYGAYIEVVADGTVSGESALIRLGTDGSRVNRMIDATNMLLTKYASNKTVVLLKFVDAGGTTQYLIHNTDAATAVSVTSSAPS